MAGRELIEQVVGVPFVNGHKALLHFIYL